MTNDPAQNTCPSCCSLSSWASSSSKATPDEVIGRMAWAPERCTAGGVLHGGALMGLADSLGGVCAFLNLPEGSGTATISSSTTSCGRFARARSPGRLGRSTSAGP